MAAQRAMSSGACSRASRSVLRGRSGKAQPFTSAKNRMHCIISAANAPAPSPDYSAGGEFVSLPLYVYHRSRLAKCWHNGTLGGSCAVRFDIGGTPRVLRVLTQVMESGGTLRLSGNGIDGGLRGAQRLASTLYRGAVPAPSTADKFSPCTIHYAPGCLGGIANTPWYACQLPLYAHPTCSGAGRVR